jgi:adenylylsulfate reductase subunit B
MPPIIDKGKCHYCGTCVDVCPLDVFYGSKHGELPVVSYPEECWMCGSCVLECPSGAVKLRMPLPMMLLYK